MPATPVYQLPYPAAADPADVPVDMQELADRIEAVLPSVGFGKELAYAQITAPVNITNVAEASSILIVSAGAVTFDGATPVLIEFFAAGIITSGAANQGVILHVFDGATSLGNLAFIGPGATATAMQVPVRAAQRLTPSAGSHTYSVRGRGAVAGTNVLNAGPGGLGQWMPSWIRITRV